MPVKLTTWLQVETFLPVYSKLTRYPNGELCYFDSQYDRFSLYSALKTMGIPYLDMANFVKPFRSFSLRGLVLFQTRSSNYRLVAGGNDISAFS